MTISNSIESIQKNKKKKMEDIESSTDGEILIGSEGEETKDRKKVKKKKKRSNEMKKSSYATSSAYAVGSMESPMIIDSDDDPFGFQNNGSSSKLKQVNGSSSVGTTASIKNGVKNGVKNGAKNGVIHRQLLRPCHILLPVPLSKSQQTSYIQVKGSSCSEVKDRLLNIINVPDQQGTNET